MNFRPTVSPVRLAGSADFAVFGIFREVHHEIMFALLGSNFGFSFSSRLVGFLFLFSLGWGLGVTSGTFLFFTRNLMPAALRGWCCIGEVEPAACDAPPHSDVDVELTRG